jgi:hypothetical protein
MWLFWQGMRMLFMEYEHLVAHLTNCPSAPLDSTNFPKLNIQNIKEFKSPLSTMLSKKVIWDNG